MKTLRNKKLSVVLSVIMIILSFTSVSVFAEENVTKEISPILVTEDTVSPLDVTPTTPYIYQTSFIFNFTTPFEVYTGGNRVSISAVATDVDGNTVTGAGIHVALIEYETGNVVATLNIAADGVAKVANGDIVSGRNYCFRCTTDKLHMDTQFSIRVVSVVF